jgi:RNA polymerase sigma-70 factor, ECF subfamily
MANEPSDPVATVDAPLVAAARRGDRAAFGALYRRHARLVQAVLLARVALDSVEDLVQDVFLATIARRRAADWRRRRRDAVPLEESLPELATNPGEPEEAYDARRAIAAIHSLPEAYRETLMLRFVAGLNGPEIAARTGLSHGSVRVNLHRGVEMLRKKLGEESRHA